MDKYYIVLDNLIQTKKEISEDMFNSYKDFLNFQDGEEVICSFTPITIKENIVFLNSIRSIENPI